MSFADLIAMIPGINKITPKYAIEIFSKRIADYTKHKVEKYVATLAFVSNDDIKEGWIEFMVMYPGKLESAPEQYRNPGNLRFKGKARRVPDGYRLYDMDAESAVETVKSLIENYVKELKGKEIDFIVFEVDRNKSEVPCKIAINDNGEKKFYETILK